LKLIRLTPDNIDAEHICCAISDKKCADGYAAKKNWLRDQFQNGYTFLKLDVRHKVFIEYVPAEYAWAPVEAPGYVYIGCFWVAGQYKEHGYGRKLLDRCLADAKGSNGVVVLSSPRKIPYLADKKFFSSNGFEVCDTAHPYFELMALRMKKNAPMPRFTERARKNRAGRPDGLTVYFTNQCPFTEYYVNVELENIAKKHRLPLEIRKIDTLKKARANPSPFAIYSLYYRGEFLTHEIMTAKKFESIMKNL
jgi:ribosomal protein S18 acetylase RimI-like enzyme